MNNLHQACREGDVIRIQSLLNEGANVNERDSAGLTPLYYAADLKRFCYEEKKSCSDKNLIHRLVKERSIYIIEQLLNRGASFVHRNEEGVTPLHLLAENGYIRALKIALRYDIDINVRDNQGRSPLHYCVRNKNIDTALILLRKDCYIDITDFNNETVLHMAVYNADFEFCELLVDHGCNINIENKYHQTPLALALKNRNTTIASLLLDNEAVVNSTKDLQTAIYTAILTHNSHQINLLLDHSKRFNPKNVIDFRDEHGLTLLHLAVLYSDFTTVQRLLDIGIYVDALDKDLETPFYKVICSLLTSEPTTEYQNRCFKIISILLHYHSNMALSPRKNQVFSLNDILLNTSRYPSLHENILHYICSVKVAQLAVGKRYEDLLQDVAEPTFSLRCHLEITSLREVSFDGVSLYDLLKASQRKLVRYLRNQNVASISSKDYNIDFPIYFPLLRVQLNMALNRKYLLDTCIFFFTSTISVKPLLPQECIEHVLEFLTNSDLQTLYIFCKDP